MMQVFGRVLVGMLLAILTAPLLAQDGKITLANPSFEDLPRHSHPPREWTDCGFPSESPPDIQPDLTFSVSKPAFHGNTYLGLVVRDNDTWESVGQRLSAPMVKGQCYKFSINLARSEMYLSQSRITNESANYNTPAKLRIYGGFSPCDKAYLLAESDLIINYRWLEFNFKLKPQAAYTHILFEAFYQTPTLFPYNGNILLDNASAIAPIPCSANVTEEPRQPAPLVSTPTPVAPNRPQNAQPATQPRSPQQSRPPSTTPARTEPTLAGVRREDMRAGQKIRIENLQFQTDSASIKPQSYPVLDNIHRFLVANPDVVVEIGGHTNGLPGHEYADRLSAERAKAVADYLISKGVSRDRIQYRGYGKRYPIDTNDTAEGRRRNQRVEVKIIGFDG
jgi:outer membrane protein OmpA-like peptidoglycan-associated protein